MSLRDQTRTRRSLTIERAYRQCLDVASVIHVVTPFATEQEVLRVTLEYCGDVRVKVSPRCRVSRRARAVP